MCKPQSSVGRKEIGADGQQETPHERVKAPLETVGLVYLLSSFAVKTYRKPLDIIAVTVLYPYIAVSAHDYLVTFDGDDAVEHIAARFYLGQHGIAQIDVLGFGQ